MKIFHELPQIKNSIVTIGSFDGLHLGHQYLINEIKNLASRSHIEEYIITFEPHPRLVLQHNLDFRLLTTLEEKIYKLEQLGVQNLIVIPFDKELSEKTAEEFITNYILNPLNPSQVILGYDHKFGKDRKGSRETFITLKEKLNRSFEIVQIDEYKYLENKKISSTEIRNYIKTGNIHSANELLGMPYSLKGIIIKGKQIGRTLGFPTANIEVLDNNKLIPAKGVYATNIKVKGEIYKAATNIGFNPTIDLNLPLGIESYILDFSQDIYGEEVTLYFNEYIRDEQTYHSLEELKKAIENDVLFVRSSSFF